MSEETESIESNTDAAPSFRDGMSDEYKGMYEDFKDADSLMKSYHNLNQKLGGGNYIKKPADDASEDDVAEFKAKLGKELGVSDDIADYKLELPEGIEVNENLMKEISEAAKGKISPAALKSIVDVYLKESKSILEQQSAETAVDLEAMQKAWGDDFDKNTQKAFKVGVELFGNEFAEANKDNAEFMRGMLKASQPIFGEGNLAIDNNATTATPETLREQSFDLIAQREKLTVGSPAWATLQNSISEIAIKRVQLENAS